jgi:hypothetical protein
MLAGHLIDELDTRIVTTAVPSGAEVVALILRERAGFRKRGVLDRGHNEGRT